MGKMQKEIMKYTYLSRFNPVSLHIFKKQFDGNIYLYTLKTIDIFSIPLGEMVQSL